MLFLKEGTRRYRISLQKVNMSLAHMMGIGRVRRKQFTEFDAGRAGQFAAIALQDLVRPAGHFWS
jgi:hypothetical protein